ncbi:MAG: entry exclusion 1 domain-containing protein [Alphaproteobacteria bacterium]|nr:entry exclusion 1 domain-containing protein [Alphaproteobacteria bacterium]MCB9974459.1 entry exclusion 1 domain-containing protein [Rhodospirillales bacterium]
MAKVGAQRAAVLTGKSKSTIQRAMNSGKLSYSLDQNDRRVIDVSELERVFGIRPESLQADAPAKASSDTQLDIDKERLTLEVKLLELRLENAQEQIEDLKGQRDKWENQASQVLLTTQHTHQQLEDLRTDLREMEEKISSRRSASAAGTDKGAQKPVKKLSAENQNSSAGEEAGSRFFFWKKAKRA